MTEADPEFQSLLKDILLHRPRVTSDMVQQLIRAEGEVVYVSTKISAPTLAEVLANIQMGTELALELWRVGKIPLVPHTNNQYLELERLVGDAGWYQFMAVDTPLLRASDAIYVAAGSENSLGSRLEIYLARRLGKKVYQQGIFEKDPLLNPSLRLAQSLIQAPLSLP